MWTIYDIHRNLYWSEQQHCWCPLEAASLYSVEQRNHVPLRSLRYQWRFIAALTQRRQAALAVSP